MAQGKTGFARQFLEEALELAKSVHGEGSGLAALPALPMAEMLYECDNTGEAELLVEQYLPAVRQWGFVDQLASGYLVRARLAAMRGDVASALSGLREAHLVAIECGLRSEEHTSELQSLMRISYAGFCLKKNKQQRKD